MKDLAIGLGVVGACALCCGAPIIISVLASGAALGAIGGLWSTGRVVLLSGAAVLFAVGLWLVARRRTPHVHGGPDCCVSPTSIDIAAEIEEASTKQAPGAGAVFATTRPPSTLH